MKNKSFVSINDLSREKILSLLRVVLRFQRLCQDVRWSDRYPVIRIRNFVLIRIRKIDIPVFVFLCAANEDEKLFRKFVFDFQFKNADAHLQTLVAKARHVIAGS